MWYRVLIVSLLLFAAGFGAHEVMHLLLIYAVGSQGEIIARPWHLYFLDVSIWSVHAQPVQQLDVVRQSIVNFFGPFLAAVPFAVLLIYVREPIALAALVANVVILVFYAVIELLYVLMGAVWQADAPLLVTPEFNYGVPLAVIGLTASTAGLISAFGGRRIPE
jgi:hypothetical protein